MSELGYQVSVLRVERVTAEYMTEASPVLQPTEPESLGSDTIMLVLCVKTYFRLGHFPTEFRRFLISNYDCVHKTDKSKSVSLNAILIALQKF
jgi:hypothetical protein